MRKWKRFNRRHPEVLPMCLAVLLITIGVSFMVVMAHAEENGLGYTTRPQVVDERSVWPMPEFVKADPNAFEIGVPRPVSHAYGCKSQEAAETIAKMIVEQGTKAIAENPTYIAYTVGGICAWGSGIILPIKVTYHGDIPDQKGQIIKVLLTAPAAPVGSQELYLVIANPITGSGIVEKTGLEM